MKIIHRATGNELYADDNETMLETVMAAIAAGANLDDAYLDGANLSGANLDGANMARATLDGANLDRATLAGANLSGANLYGATLDGANLDRANLDGATLAGANLAGANLAGANLDGANMARATLDGANLDRATLAGANLSGANLYGATLDGANLAGGVRGLEDVPLVKNLDARILEAVEASVAAGNPGLDMTRWHRCETTHCVAGWAIHLAGPAGYELEKKIGSSSAGALIYLRSGATVIPDFGEGDEAALWHLRERAAAAVAS